MADWKLEITFKKADWLNDPALRWNRGLSRAGQAWHAENRKYPAKLGPSSYKRTGALAAKSTYRIAERGRLLELYSTFYWKYLMYGTGIYGPKKQPIRPVSARTLAFQVTGVGAGDLLVASGVRRRKGKLVAYAKRDVYLVFRKSSRGTIWAGRLDEIVAAVKEAFRNGIHDNSAD